jgi:multiple sugar transport system ATP-binding protein
VAKIEYQELRKVFDDGTVAVDDVSLEIEDGEFMVLVGPSGSGKTTVLRITAGLDDATTGEVLIGDRVVNRVPPMDRNIAMVFQNYALYPHMTVPTTSGSGSSGTRSRRARSNRVNAAADARDRGLAESGSRRSSPAAAAARGDGPRDRPEPDAFRWTSRSRTSTRSCASRCVRTSTLHQRLRTTTLYVTHDQTEAMTMGDRVAVMRNGQIQQVDNPQVLYERPVNLFVGGFIGSPAMNFLRSPLTSEKGAVYIQVGETNLRLPDRLVRQRPTLGNYVDRELIVGIRPGHRGQPSSHPRTVPTSTSRARSRSRWAPR